MTSSKEDRNESRSLTRWLLVRIGERRFAMPAERVRAVLPWRPASSLPLARETLAGITLFRGRVLPLVDPRPALGIAGLASEDHGPIVVLGIAGGFGILVSEVLGMTRASAIEEIRSGRKAVERLDPDALLELELLRPPEDVELKTSLVGAEEDNGKESTWRPT